MRSSFIERQLEVEQMNPEIEQLHIALQEEGHGKAGSEISFVLNEMLASGMLKYHPGRPPNGTENRETDANRSDARPFWSACKADGILDRIYGIERPGPQAFLEMFVAGLLVFSTEGTRGPRIYWRKAPANSQ
jgi:hypothetical protein